MDAIMPHSGQELRDELDLAIAGRDHGISVAVIRRHQSFFGSRDRDLVHGDAYFPMFGSAWTTNYQRQLWRNLSPSDGSDTTIYEEAFDRVDTYERVMQSEPLTGATKVWEGTLDVLDKVIWDGLAGSAPRIWRTGGMEMQFSSFVPSGFPDNREVARLTQLKSPNGNTITFQYGAGSTPADPTWHRIESLTDSYGRMITFGYSAAAGSNPALVQTMTDFDGRTTHYTYGPGPNSALPELLETVTSTESADFPQGRVTAYEYGEVFTTDTRLKYNLTAITFPNQMVGATPGNPGSSRLSWAYYGSSDDYPGFVKSHTVGNPTAGLGLDAGGTTTFTYAEEDKATDDDEPMTDGPAMAVTIESAPFELPDGTTTTTTGLLKYSGLGQLVEETLTSDIRGLGGAALTREFLLDPQGNVTSSTGLMGGSVAVGYSNVPAGEDQHGSKALQTAITVTPDPSRVFSEDDIATQPELSSSVVYEPVFNKPFRVEDAEGRVTYYIYDYMENLTLSVPHLEHCLGYDNEVEYGTLGMGPHPNSYLWQLLNARGITNHPDVNVSNANDLNEDGVVDQYCGNVIKVIHPDAMIPSASPVGGGTTQSAVELFAFNAAGQLRYHKDSEENFHRRFYYQETNVDGDAYNAPLAPEAPDTDLAKGGYLRSVRMDASPGGGRNSSQNPTPVEAESFFIYQEVGGAATVGASVGQATYTRAQPIAVVDPRGITHRFFVNSHDQIVETSMAEKIPGQVPVGVTALQYWSKMKYDANGNLIELEVEDDQHGGPGGTKYQWTYDILDQTLTSVEAVGALDLTTNYEYDQRRNLTRVEAVSSSAPTADHPNLATRFYYDDRNIPYRTVRGDGLGLESSTVNEIDRNGSLKSWTDAEGDSIHVETDGYDRVVKVTARDGTVSKVKYDAVGNVLKSVTEGKINVLTDVVGGVASSAAMKLSETSYSYDARHRPTHMKAWHAEYSDQGPSSLALGYSQAAASSPGTTGTTIDEVTVYDRLGRTRFAIDSHGDVAEAKYDGLGRPLQLIDAVGNTTTSVFDKNGNALTVTESEVATTATPFTAEDFIYATSYDALNRPWRSTEPNGQATVVIYDSRSNVVTQIDQLRNQVNLTYDRANRPLTSEQWLGQNGVNGSSAANIGVITIAQSWDDLGRLKTRTDDSGNVTRLAYDALGRHVRSDLGDGTQERMAYSLDDELKLRLDQASVLATYTYDAEGRRTSATFGIPMGPVVPERQIVGTTKQFWSFDGLGRSWAMSDNNAVGSVDDVLIRFNFDSIGRVISEQQTLGGVTSPTSEFVYDGFGRTTQTWYPNGRHVVRGYDALDRLSSIHEGNGGGMIATKDYVGRSRLLRMTYGNGTELDKGSMGGTMGPGGGYDANGRTIQHKWVLPGSPGNTTVTDYISTYNGVGGIGTNRRLTETRAHLGATRTDTYTFDSAYRMTAFDRTTRNGTNQVVLTSTRTLDGVDKMTAFMDEGVDRMPKVDMHPAAGQNGLNQYSSFGGFDRNYDKNGGLQEGLDVVLPGGATAEKGLRFDALKRLSAVLDEFGATEMTYAYDPIGRRIAKVDGTGDIHTQFFYDGGWRVLEERDDLGAVTKQFVDGSGIDEHLQYRAFDAIGIASDYYYHCNSQGFVGAITDSAGAVKEQYEYRWLGEVVVLDVAGLPVSDDLLTVAVNESREGLFGNPYTFQGRRLDSETGLYHFRHRQYDPLTGSFVSVDPSGLWRHGQGNGYSAFSGDAWNRLDPLGLDDGFLAGIWKGGVAAVSGTVDAVAHPIRTAKAVGSAVRHPIRTGKAIGADVREKWKTKEGKGMLLFDACLLLTGVGAGGAAQKVTSTANRVASTAKSAGTASKRAGHIGPKPKGASMGKSRGNEAAQGPNTKGKYGETRVRNANPSVGKANQKIEVDGRTRKPDGLNEDFLDEVKNRRNVYYTKQLQDYVAYCKLQDDLVFRLWVNRSTHISSALKDAVAAGEVLIRFIR